MIRFPFSNDFITLEPYKLTHMKNLFCLAFLFISLYQLNSQNNKPIITGLKVIHDAAAKTITLNYDLSDAESDSIHVIVQQSVDGEKFINVSSSGDVWFPVFSGTNKSAIWEYPEGTDLSKIILKIIAYDNHVPDLTEMISKVSPDSLRANLEAIVGVRHYQADPEKLEEVENYIRSKMGQAGLIMRKNEFLYNNTFFNNIIGQQNGIYNDNLCLINGHFDSADDAPGADDNGTGVVGVLEAMRVMKGYFFENNIQFTNFNLEELGLIGSQKYVNSGLIGGENIVGLINYEMIGYYSDAPNSQSIPNGFELLFPAAVTQIINNQNRGDFIINCGNAASTSLNNTFFQAAAQYVPELKVVNLVVPGNGQIAGDLRRSDHAPFWDKGHKALMITDGAETRNANYHTPNDVISTINFDFLSKVTAAGIATLATIAKPLNASFLITDLATLSSNNSINNLNLNFEIFPNPVNETLFFTLNETSKNTSLKATITDSMGKILLTKNVQTNKEKQELNIKSIVPGVYFLNLSDGHTSQSKRFIVKK